MTLIHKTTGISVVLPVFFRRVSEENIRLLRDAVTSVLDQRHEGPLEVRLVDDGSPTPIEYFADELGGAAGHVTWQRLSTNQGIVGALNAGIAAAKHPLIARMDADDLWLDGKLAAQMALFEADPELTICATGMIRVDTAGDTIDTHIRPGDWAGILNFFTEGGCPFPHGSVVARKDIYQLLGGYPHSAAVRHCEDYALWSHWLRFFKPAMVEKALYSYRVSDSSVSAEYAAQQAQASATVRDGFGRLGLSTVLPNALPALARALNVSLLEAGFLTYKMWSFGLPATLPDTARQALCEILPDRILTIVEESSSQKHGPTSKESNGFEHSRFFAQPVG